MPDPAATAAAQGAANREAAVAGSIINNVNETSPFGSVTYNNIGSETIKDAEGNDVEIPRYGRTTAFSPEQQGLYNQQVQAGAGMNDLAISQIGRLQGTLNEPFNLEGLPERTTDFSQDRQRVEDAILSRLEPRFQKDEDALRTRMQVQGNTAGSEIYNNELQNFGEAKNDARIQAILAGGGEQSRLAGLSEQARQGAFTENLAVRNQPVNEISALLGGGQVSLPQFNAPYQQSVGAAPIGQYIQDDYANRQANYQNQMGGLFGLGGTAASGLFGLSDERAKTGIKKVGETPMGIPIKSFRYKAGGPRQIGVVAQDVQKKIPSAVRTFGGMKHVDYSQVA
jgi:hypothetical protein